MKLSEKWSSPQPTGSTESAVDSLKERCNMYQIDGGFGGMLCLDKCKGLVVLSIIIGGRKEYIYANPAELKEVVDALATDIELEDKEQK